MVTEGAINICRGINEGGVQTIVAANDEDVCAFSNNGYCMKLEL